MEKQMSDSRGDVAYLMADISEVKEGEIRTLFQSLEGLSCKSSPSSSVLYGDNLGKIFADTAAQPASGQECCTKPLLDSARKNQGPLVKQTYSYFNFLHAHIQKNVLLNEDSNKRAFNMEFRHLVKGKRQCAAHRVSSFAICCRTAQYSTCRDTFFYGSETAARGLTKFGGR